jgi:hypothetical protein
VIAGRLGVVSGLGQDLEQPCREIPRAQQPAVVPAGELGQWPPQLCGSTDPDTRAHEDIRQGNGIRAATELTLVARQLFSLDT